MAHLQLTRYHLLLALIVEVRKDFAPQKTKLQVLAIPMARLVQYLPLH
jgi:hypothetical protein